MNPSAYKARYESLKVYREDGTFETVRVDKYRLKNFNYNETMASEFASTLKSKGMDMPLLRIDLGGRLLTLDKGLNDVSKWVQGLTGKGQIVAEGTKDDVAGTRAEQDILNDKFQKTGSSYRELDWSLISRYVFAGKGSPEHCQIVLQLALHWGLNKAKKGELQTYADACMGLDCNGFVGNYLWHVRRGVPWYQLGVANTNHGPDATIDSYFGSQFVSDWDKIKTGITYIMGKVDAAGAILKGGGALASAGHIVITEPGDFVAHGDKESKGKFDVKVVESTASASPGLAATYYNFTAQNGSVFTMKSRGFARDPAIKMKIFAID
jgi:hypothetical protein